MITADIIQGEAMGLLKGIGGGSVDAVITDPPYASGGLKAGERIASTDEKYTRAEFLGIRPGFEGDNLDQRAWMGWCEDWLRECQRVLVPGGYCLSFTDWRQLPALTDCFQRAGLFWRGILAWDKTEGAHAPKPGYFRRQCEFIVWGTAGAVVTRTKADGGGLFPGAFRCPVRQADKHHQTGKPTEVMRWLVKCVPTGGLVVDPFAGSGTTGVAAVLEGRNFLGFEMVPEYAEIARRRIAEAAATPNLFAEHREPGCAALFG